VGATVPTVPHALNNSTTIVTWMIDVNLLVFTFFFPVLRKPPNGQVQPRAWSEAERASAATRCWVRCWIDHLRRNWLDFYFWSRASIRRRESNMLTNAIIGVSPDYEWQV